MEVLVFEESALKKNLSEQGRDSDFRFFFFIIALFLEFTKKKITIHYRSEIKQH